MPRIEVAVGHLDRLGPVIGKGAFADVRFATHDTTGKRVAVKVITNQRMCQEDRADSYDPS
eukprot:2555037-Amphidinium_carterae.1